MIRWSLENFITGTMGRGEISRADVLSLRRDVLPNGIETRDEADVLIALDRALHEKDESWGAFLVQTVVDFVVWSSRPTGRVDRETAEWLIASLGCGAGPTKTAVTIAFEIVREAETSDEALVAFVMRSRARGRHEPAAGRKADLVF
ncbi:hypothetical protein [Enterovirga aerilata]|uniref:Uncharacterized protein n=1 Tax=Enterovirga aerilata TaxID=2730920 RepID=A0A849I9D6_9HYPH|nr:hypothetical protein [Enterovirga sp. DB1703]NNM72895.1 hypothetical protein [Enterovirga sp. DB1703]